MPENIDPNTTADALPPIQKPAETVVFNDNKLQQQIVSGAAVAAMMVGFATTVIGFLQKKDIPGLLAFFQSAPALPALTLIGTAAIFIWRQIQLRKRVDKGKAAISAAADPTAPDPVLKSDVDSGAVVIAPAEPAPLTRAPGTETEPEPEIDTLAATGSGIVP
jgi:hypothetical protein